MRAEMRQQSDIARYAVIGLGSSHGDDQVGWQVVKQLPADIRAMPVVDASELLTAVETCDKVVVIDALSGDEAPGSISRLTWPTDAIAMQRCHSSHDFGVYEALALADQLGRRRAEVVLLGVQLQQCEPFAPLSYEVTQQLEAVTQLVLDELRSD